MATVSEMRTAVAQTDAVQVDSSGVPMMQIQCGAAELIPTRQYANVNIGPVVVKREVPIDFKGFTEQELASMKLAVREIQSVCEEAVAEDRQTVAALVRQSTGSRED